MTQTYKIDDFDSICKILQKNRQFEDNIKKNLEQVAQILTEFVVKTYVGKIIKTDNDSFYEITGFDTSTGKVAVSNELFYITAKGLPKKIFPKDFGFDQYLEHYEQKKELTFNIDGAILSEEIANPNEYSEFLYRIDAIKNRVDSLGSCINRFDSVLVLTNSYTDGPKAYEGYVTDYNYITREYTVKVPDENSSRLINRYFYYTNVTLIKD